MTKQPNPAAVDPVFHMHEINKVYHMGDVVVHALRGVTLDLLPGEFVVILGSTRTTRPVQRHLLLSTLISSGILAHQRGCIIHSSLIGPLLMLLRTNDGVYSVSFTLEGRMIVGTENRDSHCKGHELH